jgi:ribosomal protein S27AE
MSRGMRTVCSATPWHSSRITCPRCHKRELMRDDHFERFYCLSCGNLINDEDIPPLEDHERGGA